MSPFGSRAMSAPPSEFEPPRNVENRSADPVGFSSAMIASPPPLKVVSGAPAVTGKSAELVPPVSQALPAGSRTASLIESKSEPPTNVEKTSAEPAGFTFVTKPSPPLKVVS